MHGNDGAWPWQVCVRGSLDKLIELTLLSLCHFPSNVRGLETTATYLPDTDEFDLHSPTITATKWWIGAAGQTATHSAVYARLVINGEDKVCLRKRLHPRLPPFLYCQPYRGEPLACLLACLHNTFIYLQGVHCFLVQLRDVKTYRPMHGISIGDVGEKMGRNGIDNGWIRFDHVRLPRTAMLMKHAQVLSNGNGNTAVTSPASTATCYATGLQGWQVHEASQTRAGLRRPPPGPSQHREGVL